MELLIQHPAVQRMNKRIAYKIQPKFSTYDIDEARSSLGGIWSYTL